MMIFIFTLCTALNVVLGTIKSVQTVNGTKMSAAFWNALSFGLYSYIVVLTATADLTTVEKVIITVVCNLICVYGVKWVEEKMRKDRLWKVELTVMTDTRNMFITFLKEHNISFNYIDIGERTIFNTYCKTQEDTAVVHDWAKRHNAKYFATETKLM